MNDSFHFENDEINEVIKDIPEELPILPLRNMIVFPYTIMHLPIGIPRSEKLIKDAIKGNKLIGLITSKNPEIEEPVPGQMHEIGTIASITRVFQSPDNSLNVIVQGIERFKISSWTDTVPYLKAKIVESPDILEEGVEFEAMVYSLKNLAKEVVKMSPSFPENAASFIDQIEEPKYLTYMTAANHGLGLDEAQALLEADYLKDKIRVLISHLTHQKEILTLENKIKSEAKETLDKAHKEWIRQTGLYRTGLISEKEYDDLTFSRNKANQEKVRFMSESKRAWQEEYTTYLDNRRKLTTQIQQLEEQIRRSVILAPVSGSLEEFSGIFPGSVLRAGETIGVISPDSKLIGEIYMQSKDIAYLSTGQEVSMQVDAFPSREWGLVKAEIYEISNDYIWLNQQAVYRVKCRFPEKRLVLHNGGQDSPLPDLNWTLMRSRRSSSTARTLVFARTCPHFAEEA